MAITTTLSTHQSGRAALQARLRTASERLDDNDLMLTTSPHTDALALLGHEVELVALRQHRSQVPWMRDYDAFVVRFTGPLEAVAAMVAIGESGHTESTTTVKGETNLQRESLKTAFATAATAGNMVDLFDKLQRRSYTWPVVNGVAIPNDEVCFPRLALCHAILDSWDWEADAIRLLVGLDAFTGLGRFKEPESTRSRVSWLLAYESTLCRATAVAERVVVWRSGLPGWASDVAGELWSSDGGVSTVAEAMGTRPTMLIDPPLTYDGFIEEAHVLCEVDAWLQSVSRSLRSTHLRVVA